MAALAYFVTTLREKFEDKERGATAIEYALIVGLVSIGLVVALLAIGIDDLVNEITSWIGGQSVGS